MIKNRDQIDLAGWEFFWSREGESFQKEGTRPNIVIGYREGYEQAIRDMEEASTCQYSGLPTVESYTNSLKKLSEQAEERELIKKILDDPRNADGFSDDAHRLPKYQYQGYTYILNDKLTKIVGIEVPTTIVDRWHLEQSLKER